MTDARNMHTFVIAAYKDSIYLEQCIQSLQNQSVKSRLMITTSTPSPFIDAIAGKYKIELRVNAAVSGIADDWQFAVSQCETPYFTIAHQDDVYYPRYTESLLPYISNSIIVFCNYEELACSRIRSHTALLNIKRLLLWPFYFKRSIASAFWKRFSLRFGCPILCPSVMFNKALFDGFLFNSRYEVSLDWDMWLQLASANGSFSYNKAILVAHRIHKDSETTKQIMNHGRHREDLDLFMRLWPKPVAKILSKMYAKAYISNNTI